MYKCSLEARFSNIPSISFHAELATSVWDNKSGRGLTRSTVVRTLEYYHKTIADLT